MQQTKNKYHRVSLWAASVCHLPQRWPWFHMWYFQGLWRRPWPGTGCSSGIPDAARWFHHISVQKVKNAASLSVPSTILTVLWINELRTSPTWWSISILHSTLQRYFEVPFPKLIPLRWSLQPDWMIYDSPAYETERLTVPQCSVRDLWCTLLTYITLASCITPFSSTLISKGCWKSPTDTESSRNTLLSTNAKYVCTLTKEKSYLRCVKVCCFFCHFTVTVFSLHCTSEPQLLVVGG